MKISIGLTVFNGERYILDQLKSITQQTRLPDEIVISDDNSTDQTLKLINEFKAKSPVEIKVYINSVNLGFTKNFEKVLKHCSGDLIFLSDQDDVWYQDKIEVVLDEFDKNPDSLLLIHNADLTDEHLKKSGENYLAQVIRGFGSDSALITGALTILKRELLDYAMPFPEGLVGHDGYLHKIAALLSSRIVLPKELQAIRRHQANTSEWIASSLGKIDKKDVFISQLQTNVAENYNDRLEINKAAHEAINKAKRSGLFDDKTIDQAFRIIHLEKKAINQRNKLVQSTFLKRKLIAFSMLFCGQYKQFNGLKSFARDVIR